MIKVQDDVHLCCQSLLGQCQLYCCLAYVGLGRLFDPAALHILVKLTQYYLGL